ncbi:FAD-dependent thymidylate synthase [Streptomyces sp. NPDC006655]|uniref:FAD-dependent thymidylate synthase n=1 Tax=Streptomyces sp. NPDC006655 TaxID=3156898 RepID=UPI003451F1AD
MKVEIIASTEVHYDNALEREYGYRVHGEVGQPIPTDADALSEAAGRICYLSWGRQRPATATNAGYLGNILAQGHHSVLEHSSVTFLVRGVSRSLLAELTRHRHLSFSVVSQRYVPYGETEPVIPPALRDDPEISKVLRDVYGNALISYETLTASLVARGANRKQAREAARAVLPNAAPVDMVVTGNLRAWRDVMSKRYAPSADAEIQEFAREALALLRNIAPNSFQDFAGGGE